MVFSISGKNLPLFSMHSARTRGAIVNSGREDIRSLRPGLPLRVPLSPPVRPVFSVDITLSARAMILSPPADEAIAVHASRSVMGLPSPLGDSGSILAITSILAGSGPLSIPDDSIRLSS